MSVAVIKVIGWTSTGVSTYTFQAGDPGTEGIIGAMYLMSGIATVLAIMTGITLWTGVSNYFENKKDIVRGDDATF